MIKIFTFIIIVLIPFVGKAQTFSEDFLFGISNASAQVEDQLDDTWMEFASQKKVRSFYNHIAPEKKLQFWTRPEEEIHLAKKLGAQVFRMSVDWQRLVPEKNMHIINKNALVRYRQIIDLIHNSGMKVMLTLFHHSIPKWAQKMGGWGHPKMPLYFKGFAEDVYNALGSRVDYWNTFNEPNVFAMFVHVAGNWPPGKGSFLNAFNFSFYKGDFFKALDHMALAHNEFYDYAHKNSSDSNIRVGIAHNTAHYKEGGFLSSFAVSWANKNMNYYFPDKVKDKLDFMGINYYGSEYLTLGGVTFSKETEYNDAGRAFDPNGLFLILKDFYQRYKLPIYITENGTADSADIFRSLYIVEHLSAILAAIKEGVPVKSYIYWSLTDNFEWSDGYCPRFGLASIDRRIMERERRESFQFFSSIIKERKVTQKIRDDQWEKYKHHMGKIRLMCRAENGKDALDVPRKVKLNSSDWRFNLSRIPSK